MDATQKADAQWQFFVENRAAVVAALARGECDAILPAARGFMDGFADFLLERSVIDLLLRFPDPRALPSIPAVFFCNALLCRPLFRLDSLRQIGAVLFRSPFVLRHLGFNARQISSGFYTNAGRTPFDEEALSDFFAAVPAETLQQYHQQIASTLVSQFAELRSVLFAFLAFTLLGLCRQHDADDTAESAHPWGPPLMPMPEHEVAVYVGTNFTLLRQSELVRIILDHVDAWQANRLTILTNLQVAEQRARPSDRAP